MTEQEIKTYLKAFFIHLQEWIDVGFPESDYFSKDHGICFNLYKYMNNRPESNLSTQLMNHIDHYMYRNMFNRTSYPFNTSCIFYSKEKMNFTIYTNQRRLDFIKDQATKDLT